MQRLSGDRSTTMVSRPLLSPTIEAVRPALLFLIPLLLAIEFRLVGVVYAGEVLSLILIPTVVRNRRWILSSWIVRALLVTGVVWLGALVATDLLRGPELTTAIRGWGDVALALWMIAVFRVLIGPDLGSARTALIGRVAGLGVTLLLIPTIAESAAPLRLGGAWAITVVLLLALPSLTPPFNRIPAEVVLAALAAFLILNDARSSAGIAVAAAAVLLTRRMMPAPSEADRPTARRLVMTGLGVAGAAAIVLGAYAWLASSGELGESATYRYESQTAGELGILVGGRSELVSSALAIADSPLIGYGSRPDGSYFVPRAEAWLAERGYRISAADSDEIPNHSYVLGAWVTAGLLGLPFWLLTVWVALVGLWPPRTSDRLWTSLSIFLSMGLLWAWAFSPFRGPARMTVPLVLVIIITVSEAGRGGVFPRLGRSR